MGGQVQEKEAHGTAKSDSSENVFLVLSFAMTVVVASFLYTYSVRNDARTRVQETREELNASLAGHRKEVEARYQMADSPEYRERIAGEVWEKVKGDMDELRAKMTALENAGKLEDLTRSVAQLEKNVAALSESVRKSTADATKRHDELQKNLEASRSAVLGEAETKIEAARKESADRVVEVAKSVATAQQATQALNGKLGELTGRVEDLRGALEEHKKASQAQHAELAKAGQESKTGAAATAEATKGLAERIEKLSATVAALAENVKALEAKKEEKKEGGD